MITIKKIGSPLLHGSINLVLLLFSFSCVFPILWIINSSLRTNADFMSNITLPAFNPEWQNYSLAMTSRDMGQYFINSVYLTVISVILVIIISFVVGYFFARYQFPGKNIIYTIFLMGLIIPTLSLMIPVFMMFNKLNLLDKWYTLILPYVAFNLPLSIILIDNYIRGIPKELDEAARIDGASLFQIMSRVILPVTKPIIATTTILNTMVIWNEFPFALILIRSPKLQTISVGLSSFKSLYTMDYTLYMAALVISMLPVIIVFVIFSKRIIQGMTTGAVKG